MDMLSYVIFFAATLLAAPVCICHGIDIIRNADAECDFVEASLSSLEKDSHSGYNAVLFYRYKGKGHTVRRSMTPREYDKLWRNSEKVKIVVYADDGEEYRPDTNGYLFLGIGLFCLLLSACIMFLCISNR